MSKIRQELEFYRLGNTIETEIGSDNVSDLYNNTYATSGQLKDVTEGTDIDDTTTMAQLSGSAAIDGFQRFPNGTMMVWGVTTTLELTADLQTDGDVNLGVADTQGTHTVPIYDLASPLAIVGLPASVTFTYPFATTCYNVSVTISSNAIGGNDALETMYQIQNISNTGFDIKYGRGYGVGGADYFKFHYQAIGDWDMTA